MEPWTQPLITMLGTAICSVLASSGFWAYMQSKDRNKSAERKIMLGLAHDRIIDQCDTYTTRGFVYEDEYKDLKEYLYDPYISLGGDGSAEKAFNQVQQLPMKYR